MERPNFKNLLLALALAAPTAGAVDYTAHYCLSYDACRTQFLNDARDAFQGAANVESGAIAVPSQRADEKLTIDWAYRPATGNAKHLVVLVSGVHGVEGFAGSAVQDLFFKKTLKALDKSPEAASTGILVVHGVNPWGFKYLRRVNEDNVDLNRNFDLDERLFKTENAGYRKLDYLLNPKSQAGRGILSYAGFYWSVARLLLSEPMATLREATLKGQYEYPRGVYFGGKSFSAQKKEIEALLTKVAAPYDRVLFLDVHTGYGNRGQLHLFGATVTDPQIQSDLKATFDGYPIDEPSGEDFYETSGDFLTYGMKLYASQKKRVVPMVLEYGTIGNLGYRGSIESLRRMIAENQLHWYGATDTSTEKKIRAEMVDLYLPNDRAWRNQIMDVTDRWLPVWVEQFRRLK